MSEEEAIVENDDTSESKKNKTKPGKNQSTTAETATLSGNEIMTMAPNETVVDWKTTIQDDSDSGVTDAIPTKEESTEKVAKPVKDEITEDKAGGDVGFFYPWESPVCEDVHGDKHCSKFKDNFRQSALKLGK